MSANDVKSRAAARLAGMNLTRVLDVDGSGVIDPGVLERSLQQFDASVFTKETVKELLADVGEEARQGGRIVIRDFALLVTAPYPIACRASSLDSHVDGAISGVTLPVSPTSSAEGFRDVFEREALDRTSRGSLKDLERLSADLKQRAKDYFLESQRQSIGPLWDDVDREQAGALSPEACKDLVAAYLAALVPKSGDLARSAIELGVELSVLVCERRMGPLADDDTVRERLRARAKIQVDALSAKVAPLVEEQMSKMAQGSPGDVVAELLQTLELTPDGKVTRDAFEAHFVESMQHVLGPERMVERAHRASTPSTGPDDGAALTVESKRALPAR